MRAGLQWSVYLSWWAAEAGGRYSQDARCKNMSERKRLSGEVKQSSWDLVYTSIHTRELQYSMFGGYDLQLQFSSLTRRNMHEVCLERSYAVFTISEWQ
jgi:hypothetical protein